MSRWHLLECRAGALEGQTFLMVDHIRLINRHVYAQLWLGRQLRTDDDHVVFHRKVEWTVPLHKIPVEAHAVEIASTFAKLIWDLAPGNTVPTFPIHRGALHQRR